MKKHRAAKRASVPFAAVRLRAEYVPMHRRHSSHTVLQTGPREAKRSGACPGFQLTLIAPIWPRLGQKRCCSCLRCGQAECASHLSC